VAEAALQARVSRYVHCSSIHAYDLEACIGTAVDERSPATLAPNRPAYDRSKALGQRTVLALAERGLDAVCVNPTSIIGAPDPNPSRMGAILLALWRRRLPAIVDGGFDWVDVRDVVQALRSAAEVGRPGQAYLINGHRLSFAALAEAAAASAGRPMLRRTAPGWLVRAIAPLGTILARASTSGTGLIPTTDALHALRCDPVVDATLARSELGHQPRPIADTLAGLHRYFIDHGQLSATSR
jgi:dihydroflavonol-4-reductase